MAQSYLDKFRSSLPNVQGKQILKLLISKRDNGEIRTIDEFKSKLTELTQKLLEERITPTLVPFFAEPGIDTSSEQLNEMIDRIQDDLQSAFSEADNLDEIIFAHHNLINNVVLKSLRFGINELESKINLYEFLNKNPMGFDDSLFNTFRESKNLKTSRSDAVASLVYVDPRSKSSVSTEEDSFKDLIGERLLLGNEEQIYLSIKNAEWLANANSIRSELDVTFPNVNINNIIDGLNNTFWIVPILLSQVKKDGVPMEICLNLNGTRDINFIELEPASDYPMVVLGIDYLDTNNIRKNALSNNNQVEINGPTKINFDRITTSCVIIKLRQDNYKEIQFTQKPGESNFHKAVLGQSLNNINLESVSDNLKNILSSEFILSDIFGIKNESLSQMKFFEYVLGFDNIRLGFSSFRERGIFVSSKKNILNPGQFGLKTIEVRPVQLPGSSNISLINFNYPTRNINEDQKFFHGSIEYWLTMQIFGENNYLIDTVTVPILPIGAQRIYHERVIFTRKSDQSVQNSNLASLMFFTDPNPNDIIVYRNGTPLKYGIDSLSDWEFVAELPGDLDTNGNLLQVDDPEITLSSPNSGSSMKRGIHIWDTVRPLDIYTVSYTPKVSNTQVVPRDLTLLQVVDLIGDLSIRSVDNNIIIIENIKNSNVILNIDIYLTILFRRNSANTNISPALEEYMLVTGKRNKNKFIKEI